MVLGYLIFQIEVVRLVLGKILINNFKFNKDLIQNDKFKAFGRNIPNDVIFEVSIIEMNVYG